MMSHINVWSDEDVNIRELAEIIAQVTGFRGKLRFDVSKLDGTPRKLLDVSRLNLMGWSASIGLMDGLQSTYEWFIHHEASFRR